MKVNLTKQFKYAHNGIHVEAYGPGECDLPEEAAVIAVDNGFGEYAVGNLLEEAVERVIPAAAPRRKTKKKKGSR